MAKVKNFKRDAENIKSKYMTFVLYPSNAYHCILLDYLKATYDGFYIKHKHGDELYYTPYPGFDTDLEFNKADNKEHIHVMLIFKNPRTVSGFLKSLPTVRYYFTDEMPNRFFTVYDISYLPLPFQEVSKPILEHAEIVSDTSAMALYFLHKDLKSLAMGKEQYEIKDIEMLNSDRSLLDEFYNNVQYTESELIDQIQQLYYACDSKDAFIQLLCLHSNKQLIKYVSSHSYFINTFIIQNERKEVINYD